jgi:hypothetical protein
VASASRSLVIQSLCLGWVAYLIKQNTTRARETLAERAGIEPATDGVIRPLLVLKTSWNTSSILSASGVAAQGRAHACQRDDAFAARVRPGAAAAQGRKTE